MNIVIDTHALLWLLTNDKKINARARQAVRGAMHIYVPTIVLLELLYLLNKKTTTYQFSSILNNIKRDKKFIIVSLDITIVEFLFQQPIHLEMHDNIITATAKLLKSSIVTKDKEIKEIYKKTIW